MTRKREWIGIVLLIVTLVGFVVWEGWGRKHYQTTEVIVAAEEIPAGRILLPEHFTRARVDKASVMDGALTAYSVPLLEGKRAAVSIPKNAQIATPYILDDDYVLKEGESVYVLKGEWIALRSSSLRRGDWIDLYVLSEESAFEQYGRYRVAFVKDANESEVKNTSDAANTGPNSAPVLSRTSSTAAPYSVEIIATEEAYKRILDALLKEDTEAVSSPATTKRNGIARLMIVQVNG